eukprot:TRINITY_DN5809_c0_g1_i3.p1 TRINITY_DN5809_c0_g1~~TRINITY_DN5809_c0_g1_i3.p1  ORF type:complete len:492 (-),score=25.09 TRINITY_DN5809_c0_g1_i3:2542-3828(-)
MLPFQTVLILGIGSFIAYIVRGLTGFGSGMIMLATWIIFSTLGFDVGIVQIIIVGELITNLVISIPFLFLTKFCKYGDYGLCVIIIFWYNLMFVVGAYFQKLVSQKKLELILAVFLLVVVVSKYVFVFHKFCVKRLSRKVQKSDIQRALVGDEQVRICQRENTENVNFSFQSIGIKSVHGLQTNNTGFCVKNGQNNCYEIGDHMLRKDNQKTSFESSDLSEFLTSEDQNSADDDIESSNSEFESACCGEVGKMTYDCFSSHLQALAYIFTCRCKVQKSDTVDAYYIGFTIQNGRLCMHYNDRFVNHSLVLIVGSMSAGIMGGLVGLEGPALMYMFQFLNIPKDVARANVAAPALFRLSILIYIMFGDFYPQYGVVYTVDAITGLMGLAIGSFLSKYINTQQYYHQLMVLMFASAVILLLRGVGVIDVL